MKITEEAYSKILKGLAAAGCVILAAIVFTVIWAWTHCIAVGWRFYPKDAQALDLRGKHLSVEQFDTLSQKLPGCEIVWDVPFQDKLFSSETRRITVMNLTDADVERLDYLTALEEVDGRQCSDYPQLALLQQRHPNCTVLYQVSIRGVSYSQDTQEISLPNLTFEEARLLDYLPRLTTVNADGCNDYALLASLQDAHPQWTVRYTVNLGEEIYPSDSESITVENASYQELTQGLVCLTKLQSILLRNPEADYSDLTALRREYPQISIDWELTLGDRTFPSDTRELDISFMPIKSLEDAERIADYFPDLEKLILDSGSIDNDTMAEFRERKRADYKVVWTVICGTGKFGSFPVRTDETTFMPLKHRIYFFHDDDMYNLRYCEDMVCIDVGHMTFTDVSFVENMPHLKYLILNMTSVKDITPLSTCKELVFLELDHSWVQDYSPLLGCTALEDLNLGDTYGDPAPIAQMTWLKNLWWVGRSFAVKTKLQETLTNTNMLFHSGKNTTGYGWRQLPNYYAMRDMLEMPYMK